MLMLVSNIELVVTHAKLIVSGSEQGFINGEHVSTVYKKTGPSSVLRFGGQGVGETKAREYVAH